MHVQYFCWMILDRFLLQVAVDLKAVVPRVCHSHVSFRGESKTLRAVQRVC